MFRTLVPSLQLPLLSFFHIPNINDYVQLSNDLIGIVSDLQYLIDYNTIIYTVYVIKNRKFIRNVHLQHINQNIPFQYYLNMWNQL